uniref:Uncharacterized protein n=1 Tax=viral metagenome TaxID=1070528 RepID=A0A6C0E5Y1_9ZZZZ
MTKISIKETPFLSKQNVNLLWEVLLDEPNIRHISPEEKTNLYVLFSNHLAIFSENSNPNSNTDLTYLNKTFLGQMIRMIRSNINVNTSTNKNAYKVEDIQAHRQQQFEAQLAEKRNDFEASMTLVKPPVPNFTEKIEDEKIKGMDELIAKTVAQRNFDISQISMNPVNTKWLQPQQTSTKIKIQEDISNLTPIEVVELPKANSKKLSWNDARNQLNIFDTNDTANSINTDMVVTNPHVPLIESNFSILNKLKRVVEEPSISMKLENTSIPNDYAELKEKMNSLELKMNTMLDSIHKLFEIINQEKVT